MWTHYLKLFLGHAAYAQTLVLAIFMGGHGGRLLDLQPALARWANLLRATHWPRAPSAWSHCCSIRSSWRVRGLPIAQIIPALASPVAVTLSSGCLPALLILPQSVLLGMTFPLMAGGFIRAFPERPGASLAILYFCNSIGGAVGVLASGFV